MNSNQFLNQVRATIEKYDMIKPGESVLTAISGGADSVALVHVLLKFAEKSRIEVAAAHFDHGLRGVESERDAEFVRSLAANLKLAFYRGKADVGTYARDNKLSVEEAARKLRYEFLNETAIKHGFDKIALGHHNDDNAETVLICLLRGSGPSGLSGIAPVRGKIVRPLIESDRGQIERFLAENNIEFVDDSSNADFRYMRNRVRHHLLPILKKDYNPAVVDALTRTARIVGDEKKWLDSLVCAYTKEVMVSEADDNVVLLVSKLKRTHKAAARRIVRKAVDKLKGNLRRIESKHVEAVLELAEGHYLKGAMDLPGSIRIERNGDRLVFAHRRVPARPEKYDPRNDFESAGFLYSISSPGTVFIEETGASIELTQTRPPAIDETGDTVRFPQDTVCEVFDLDRISFPLTIRSFRPGDFFRPLGLSGKQKLKKFFIDKKVPAEDRRRVPIVESGGKIIWVAGYRIDDSVKITRRTRRALKAKLVGSPNRTDKFSLP